MQPIVTLTLSLEDARELYRAVVARAQVEDALRREQGLEAVDPPALAERLEHVLGIRPEAAAKEAQAIEDGLWQHAWLSFTDEWAWHRAKQDIEKELKRLKKHRLSQEEIDRATEARYEQRFDDYLEEIQLPGHEDGGACEKTAGEPVGDPNQKPSRHA